jgi:DNA-binding transcriptional LysR family regulator
MSVLPRAHLDSATGTPASGTAPSHESEPEMPGRSPALASGPATVRVSRESVGIMNIHHLELFYYVARHGGISEAVRNIPYGIQQPAVSAQIIQLEESLGVTLFHRRPFSLSSPGEKLFRFIQPFFEGLEPLADELRGGAAQQLRFGASGTILRDHLPELAQYVRKRFPDLKLTLREGHQPQLETWLQKQEIDLAVTLLEGKPPPGVSSLPLLKLPLILLVAKSSRLFSPEVLWKRDKIEEALISLPPYEAIPKHFQQGLSRLGIDWFPRIEVSSLALIETYVQSGYGIGLSVAIPRAKLSPKIRAVPLDGFIPVTLAALWPGKLTPLIQAVLEEFQRRAQSLTN